MIRGTFIILSILIHTLLISETTQAQSTLKTNQDILFDLISQYLDKNPIQENRYWIQLELGTAQSLVSLQSLLIDAGYQLTTDPDGGLSMIIRFFPDIELRRLSRSSWNRIIQGTATLTIVDQSEIVLSEVLDLQFSDYIDKQQIKLIETDFNPTRIDRFTDHRPWLRSLRIAEPVLITAAIGTTVYLLYNIRSQ